jgi:hypothetical protein
MKNNITEGKWQVFKNPFLHIESNGQWIAQTSEIKEKPTEWLSPEYEAEEIRVKKEEESNANLIADAGTTANKCGLLPSELLAQRDELLECLKTLLNLYTGTDKPSTRIVLEANAIIKNCTNETT